MNFLLSSIVLPPLLVLFALLLCDSLFRAVFLGIALRSAKEPSLNPASQGEKSRIAYIFPAHNEESVIEKSVAGLSVPIYVIADNCQDKTAEVARGAGARVWERSEESGGGKAGALRWFFKVGGDEITPYSRFAIFDADSQVASNFADQLTLFPYDQTPVVQGFVQPIVTSGSPVARLTAYSEILSQCIDDLARERLGWPAPLRGTGMVFDASLLPTLLSGLRTKVEDVEMTIQLVRRGIHPRFLVHAVVGDPKPAGMQGVAAQRARWEQGRRQILRFYWRDLLSLFCSGHPGLMALSLSVVMRPRALVLIFKVLVAFLFGTIAWSHGRFWVFLTVMGWLAVMIDGLYYVVGLAVVKERRAYALALIFAPAYLFMWIWSQTWSFVSRSTWLSVRDLRK